MDVCIINYNTPELVSAAIASLRKNTRDASVTVFDNSDKLPFRRDCGVSVIDNTSGQIIDFVEFLERFPHKLHTTINDWGSAKHTYTVQKLWEYFPDGFVLMDSDVLVKKDISDIVDTGVAYAGQEHVNRKNIHSLVPRVLPMLCWINVPMCVASGIKYFDPKRNWKLTGTRNPKKWYDTGASFLEDCRRAAVPAKNIDISEYILHYGAGSYKRSVGYEEWLEENKELWK